MGSTEVVWKLVYASANSPLTIEVEATPRDTEIEDVDSIARVQKSRLSRNVAALIDGAEPPDVSELANVNVSERLRAAERFFTRNLNGVGRTEIDVFDGAPPLVVDSTTAKRAVTAIDSYRVSRSKEHKEVGSIEGTLESAQTYFRKAAIYVKDRRTANTIRCMINAETRDEIAKGVAVEDIWHFQRVRVRGIIYYDKDGQITQVDARQVERINPGSLSAKDLYDPDFTDGLEPSVYLDKLREGELG